MLVKSCLAGRKNAGAILRHFVIDATLGASFTLVMPLTILMNHMPRKRSQGTTSAVSESSLTWPDT